MKKWFFLFLLSSAGWAIGQPQADLTSFLKRKGIKKDSVQLHQTIRQFLSVSQKKGQVKWYQGSIVSTDSVSYENLSLKYNVVDNSTLVLHKDQLYSLPSFSVISFKIIDDKKIRSFKKGYGISHIHTIEGTCQMSTQDFVAHLTTFELIDSLQIRDFKFSENNSKFHLRIETPFANLLESLEAHLRSNKDIIDIKHEFDFPAIKESTFLEELYSDDKLTLLKRHFKKSNEPGSSLVKSDIYLFSQKEYYFSNQWRE